MSVLLEKLLNAIGVVGNGDQGETGDAHLALDSLDLQLSDDRAEPGEKPDHEHELQLLLMQHIYC